MSSIEKPLIRSSEIINRLVSADWASYLMGGLGVLGTSVVLLIIYGREFNINHLFELFLFPNLIEIVIQGKLADALVISYFILGSVSVWLFLNKGESFFHRLPWTEEGIVQLKEMVKAFYFGSVILPASYMLFLGFFIWIFMPSLILVLLGFFLLIPIVLMGKLYQISKTKFLSIIREGKAILETKWLLIENLVLSVVSFPLLVVFLHFSGLDIVFSLLSIVIFNENAEFLFTQILWGMINTIILLLSMNNSFLFQLLDSFKGLIVKFLIFTLVSEVYLLILNRFQEQFAQIKHYSQGWIWWNMGFVHHSKGEYGMALDYFKKSKRFFDGNRELMGLSQSLALLVIVNSDLGFEGEVTTYLEALQTLHRQTKRKKVELYTTLAQAYVLKTSSRLVDKTKALEQFQTLDPQQLGSYHYIPFMLFNLLELLTLELKSTGNEKAFEEMKFVVKQLVDFAESQKSSFLLIQAYVLQSKIAILEFDLKTAQRCLVKADQLIKKKKILELSKLILYEHYAHFIELMQGSKEFLNRKKSIQERVQSIEMTEIVVQGLHKYLNKITDKLFTVSAELEPFREYIRNVSSSNE